MLLAVFLLYRGAKDYSPSKQQKLSLHISQQDLSSSISTNKFLFPTFHGNRYNAHQIVFLIHAKKFENNIN